MPDIEGVPSQMFSYFSISAEGATFLVEANRLQGRIEQGGRESGKEPLRAQWDA